MSKKQESQLDVSFVLEQGESEFVASVRTTDGAKLTEQDVLDGLMAALEECYGMEMRPVTKQDIEDDTHLN